MKNNFSCFSNNDTSISFNMNNTENKNNYLKYKLNNLYKNQNIKEFLKPKRNFSFDINNHNNSDYDSIGNKLNILKTNRDKLKKENNQIFKNIKVIKNKDLNIKSKEKFINKNIKDFENEICINKKDILELNNRINWNNLNLNFYNNKFTNLNNDYFILKNRFNLLENKNIKFEKKLNNKKYEFDNLNSEFCKKKELSNKLENYKNIEIKNLENDLKVLEYNNMKNNLINKNKRQSINNQIKLANLSAMNTKQNNEQNLINLHLTQNFFKYFIKYQIKKENKKFEKLNNIFNEIKLKCGIKKHVEITNKIIDKEYNYNNLINIMKETALNKKYLQYNKNILIKKQKELKNNFISLEIEKVKGIDKIEIKKEEENKLEIMNNKILNFNLKLYFNNLFLKFYDYGKISKTELEKLQKEELNIKLDFLKKLLKNNNLKGIFKEKKEINKNNDFKKQFENDSFNSF